MILHLNAMKMKPLKLLTLKSGKNTQYQPFSSVFANNIIIFLQAQK